MNDITRLQSTPTLDQQLQRLVDGELSAAETRQLLGRLDSEPGGWRRCALLLLEEQVLRRELSSHRSADWQWLDAAMGTETLVANAFDVDEPSVGTNAVEGTFLTRESTNGAVVRSARWSKRSKRWSAAALALCTTLLLVGAYFVGQPAGDNQNPRDQMRVVARHSKPGTEQQPNNLDPGAGDKADPIGRVKLVVNGSADQPAQSMELPVYEWDPKRRRPLPSDTTQALAEALRKTGRQVHREAFLTPVSLEDGRQVIFPVERLHITPVASSPMY